MDSFFGHVTVDARVISHLNCMSPNFVGSSIVQLDLIDCQLLVESFECDHDTGGPPLRRPPIGRNSLQDGF